MRSTDLCWLAMRRMTLLLLLVALTSSACRSRSRGTESAADTLAAVRQAHDAYVNAINVNKTEAWLETLADDVVYLVPNQSAIVGKADVGVWVAGYLAESRTHWTKPLQDLEVAGDWAFGRYTYTVSDDVIIHDPETEGGGTANDSGWGFIVYRRDGLGGWRVARDAWGSARAAR